MKGEMVAEKEPYEWETIWDDSEEYIDNYPLHSVKFDEERGVFRISDGGHVSTVPAERLTEIVSEYYEARR